MAKTWKVLPKIEGQGIKYPGINPVVLQLLINRGLKSKEEMKKFLEADYKEANDPALFNQMKEAVELVVSHIKKKNKILVYGDYDADGVTASAVMVETLKTLKAEAEVYIPFRTTEGYGLNINALDEAKAGGARLIITVDNGIRNHPEVEHAKKLGLDVIVTDHHPAPEDKPLPDCLIIDPLVKKEKYPFRQLAGVGVAFKLALALILRAKLPASDQEKLEERLLDLVAIGTVADLMPLKDENRILVKKGLEILNKTKRLGVKELIKISQNSNGKKLEAWNISFQLGPRLNAAGRLDHANTAYELLVTRDSSEAKKLAASLNSRNCERQMITEKTTEEIIAKIESLPDCLDDKIIIAVTDKELGKEVWNEGVVGLIAGRLAEKFYLPALVITVGNGGEFKGSGRSIGEFNLIHAIEGCSKYLDKYGGHPAACGFSVKEKGLNDFMAAIRKAARKELGKLKLRPKITIDAEIDLAEINSELVSEIDRLAPFGPGNERPKFLSRKLLVMDIMRMGAENQHIKFRLKSESSGLFFAIGFSQSEEWSEVRIGDRIDLVYYPEINEYNGRREVQLKIIDIKIKS